MKPIDNTTPHMALEYDQKVRKTIPFYEYFSDETLDLVTTIKPDVRVWLDTGCGTGGLIRKAFHRFPETNFILSDPSEQMLEQTKHRLKELPLSRLSFLAPIGTEDLPLNGIPHPQVITALQAHHYLSAEKRELATQRCFDLLPKDGLYITFENIRPNSDKGIEIGLNRWKRYQVFQGKEIKQVETHGKRFDTAYFPVRVDEHFRLLEKCGFRVAELFWFSHMQAGFYAIK
jgi:tRNA (cmo5U34)-methyltransferase